MISAPLWLACLFFFFYRSKIHTKFRVKSCSRWFIVGVNVIFKRSQNYASSDLSLLFLLRVCAILRYFQFFASVKVAASLRPRRCWTPLIFWGFKYHHITVPLLLILCLLFSRWVAMLGFSRGDWISGLCFVWLCKWNLVTDKELNSSQSLFVERPSSF